MHLLLLGASGKCGQWVARLAKQRGHQITAIVRSPLQSASVNATTTIVGDVCNPDVLRAALASGVEAIVCCLGIRRANPRNPWSRILGVHSLVGPVASALAHVNGAHLRKQYAGLDCGSADTTRRWFAER